MTVVSNCMSLEVNNNKTVQVSFKLFNNSLPVYDGTMGAILALRSSDKFAGPENTARLMRAGRLSILHFRI